MILKLSLIGRFQYYFNGFIHTILKKNKVAPTKISIICPRLNYFL